MLTYILIGIGIYALLVSGAYFLQERFIFHPEKLHEQFKFSFKHKFREIKLNTSNTDFIDGLLFQANQKKGVIFYFKGNTRSIKGWSKFSLDFITLGYDVFMIDYPGFGKSIGSKSETNICNDCKVAYDWLKAHYDEQNIIIYGRSFGTGIATKVAAETNPQMLVLDSPYYSFIKLAHYYTRILPLKWILKYKIPLNEYMQRVKCPTYIIHGTKDRIIPFSHSKKLNAEFPHKIKLLPIANAKHNNLPTFNAYHVALHNILGDKQ
jgi:uncharacterized protein